MPSPALPGPAWPCRTTPRHGSHATTSASGTRARASTRSSAASLRTSSRLNHRAPRTPVPRNAGGRRPSRAQRETLARSTRRICAASIVDRSAGVDTCPLVTRRPLGVKLYLLVTLGLLPSVRYLWESQPHGGKTPGVDIGGQASQGTRGRGLVAARGGRVHRARSQHGRELRERAHRAQPTSPQRVGSEVRRRA